MSFYQLTIYTDTRGVDILTATLTDIGISGFVISDSADFYDFKENCKDKWDYIDDELETLKTTQATSITIYLPTDNQGKSQLDETHALLEKLRKDDDNGIFGSLKTEVTEVHEEDWENNWKAYYKPFEIGRNLIIKPQWETIENREQKLVLEIDPASTFGTGQHATTKLCIEELENVVEKDVRILDLGCGSGILSIAALLFGAKNATIVDITENAVTTASENIRSNGFSDERFTAYCGDICKDNALREHIGSGYKIVVANIVADVIIAMSSIFAEFMTDDGILLVSGIIDNRVDEVKTALQQNGYRLLAHNTEEDWNLLKLSRI